MQYVRYVLSEDVKRRKRERLILVFSTIFFVFSFIGMSVVLFQEFLRFTGYDLYVNASAGTILPVQIVVAHNTTKWHGIYGLALRVPGFTEQQSDDLEFGKITRKDLFFDCIQSGLSTGTEVYASLASNISFDNMLPATPQMIDDFLGCSGLDDCADNTFTTYITVYVGSRNLTVPATHTYRYDGNHTAFDIGAINASGQLVFVTHIGPVQRAFNQQYVVNYQMLLPTPPNTTQTYYFFTDPNDECPAGGIGELISVNVFGYINDSQGNRLSGISVSVGGSIVTSDFTGFYNLTTLIPVGTYNLIAWGQGYDVYVDNINVSFTDYVFNKNFTMRKYTPGLNTTVDVSIWGYAKDTSSQVLADVNVSFAGFTTKTDINGFYNLSVTVPPYPQYLVALKQNYNNYFALLNITENTTNVHHNITMEPIQIFIYPTGPYTSGPYSAPPGVQQQQIPPIPPEIQVTAVDYWVSTKEIVKEVRQNTFIEELVGIYNLKNAPMQVFFSLSPELADFVTLDKQSLIVSPQTAGSLIVTIYGSRPVGVYNGTLTLSGDINQIIPVSITVVENKLPIENLLIEIDLLDRLIRPGGRLNYRLRLQNLLIDQNYLVTLRHAVREINASQEYVSEDETIEIQRSVTLFKSLVLPDTMTPKDYLLQVDAKYLGFFSRASVVFRVQEPLYLYAFVGIPLWIWFLLLTGLSSLILAGVVYKRHLDLKKRYLVPINYDQLPKAGERSIRVGKLAETTVDAYIDLDKLTTHSIVAGSTGMGKSVAAQVVIEEALQKGIGVIVFDPTAQWTGMLRKCDDKRMIDLYPKFGLKPGDAKAFNGNIRQVKDAREIIEINRYRNPGQIQVFALNKLDPKDMDIFVTNVIKQVFASNPQESPDLKLLLVFDEVHRLLAKFGGSGEGFLQIERACREFRKWGIGLILISQVLSDFVGEIKANINTEVQARTIEETDLERIRVKYGGEILKSLVKASVGVVMLQNAEYNRGRPYFVNFRPLLHSTKRLTDAEIEKYNSYNSVYDDLEYQVQQLEKEGVDIFDFKMELKLVLDKIKQGNFAVVDIYLEGLKPRLESAWKKLGKKPKQFEIKLADVSALKKSVEEAKKSREEAEGAKK